MAKQPMQAVVYDDHGVVRFQPNELVRYLLDHGQVNMNVLAATCFPDQDREQFAQLIGYSVSGFGDLSYVRPKTLRKADRRAAKLIKSKFRER